jgi:nucleoside-diphosphate-sugar epimerase
MYPVYYADVIDCYLLAAKKMAGNQRDVAGKVFAVRDNKPYKINEIIAAFEKISGGKILVKYGDWPKPSKETERIWRGTTLPSWRLKYSLLQGIKSMLEE